MDTELIVVPYVLGHEGVGMGAGPVALELDAVEALRPRRVERLALSAPFAHEIGAVFDLNRQLAASVAQSVERGAVPVVLTGNCNSQQAVVAGLGADTGLVWLDCHADFNTPETTASGFFDGCALSLVVGDCFGTLCATVPGSTPLDPARVVLAGARDIDPGERTRLDASAVTEIAPADIAQLPAAAARLGRVSLHLDLDVLDPAHGVANPYAVGPGLTRDEVLDAVRGVREAATLTALTLSAYDPAYDEELQVRDLALAVLEQLAGEG